MADLREKNICLNCKNLMFSDCYGECSRGYKGIVRPDDSCEHFESNVKTPDIFEPTHDAIPYHKYKLTLHETIDDGGMESYISPELNYTCAIREDIFHENKRDEYLAELFYKFLAELTDGVWENTTENRKKKLTNENKNINAK